METEKTLSQQLASVGVEVRRVVVNGQFKGMALYDTQTKERLHLTPTAHTDFGWEIYNYRMQHGN